MDLLVSAVSCVGKSGPFSFNIYIERLESKVKMIEVGVMVDAEVMIELWGMVILGYGYFRVWLFCDRVVGYNHFS